MKVALGSFGEIDLRWWLLAALMVPLPIALGFWQLDRADQKLELESRLVEREVMPPLACSQLPQIADPAFVRIQLSGHFANDKQFVLDNRTQQGKAGFEILTPFECAEGGPVVLVNRGWIEASGNRALPDVRVPETDTRLVGFVYVSGNLPAWLTDDQWPSMWPKLIGTLDMPRAAAQIPGLYAWSVIAEPGQPQLFAFNFARESLSPTKHWGYAVQWFAIALGIVLYLGYRSRQKHSDS